MNEAIIYCRFSPRPDADTSTSNDRQEERCRAYCAAHDYNVVGLFQDRNISGGTMDRPQLQAALDYLDTGMVLVVDSSDRLARDMLVYVTIQARVTAAGARTEFADGTPPSTTPEGEFVANILAAHAQLQRATIRRKTKSGLARKRDGGMYLGKCPIGYKRDAQGELIEDDDEKFMTNVILGWHARKLRSGDIAAGMNVNYGPIRGKPWNERTIRRIIKRETSKQRS